MPADTAGIYAANEGDALTLRAFDGDRAIAFNSTVLRSCVQPYQYLHLSYPQRLEQVVVRHSRRLNVERDSLLLDGAQEVPVRVLNLSMTGALLAGPVGAATLGATVGLKTTLPFKGLGDQPLNLDATVRNIKDEVEGVQTRSLYGVAFNDLPVAMDIVLRAFVFERLYSREA